MGEPYLSIREAARVLGVSLDTLRRWDQKGTIEVVRDAANRRMIPESEVRRLAPMRAERSTPRTGSARNRMLGSVTSIEFDGFLARVEMETVEPARLVAVITREAAEELDLAVGSTAVAVVKATSMMIERAPK